MLVLPFTVTIRDTTLEIPASEKEVLDFLEAADKLDDIDPDDYESPLEIPFYPDEISIDYIDYESYASDYMMQVESEVTEYGTIILKD